MEIKTYQVPVVQVQAVRYPKFNGFLVADEDSLLSSKNSADSIFEWVKSSFGPGDSRVTVDPSTGAMMILTRSGMTNVEPGSWIVKNSDGTFTVCADSEFRSKYVEVTE